jgi:hypothetical protein
MSFKSKRKSKKVYNRSKTKSKRRKNKYSNKKRVNKRVTRKRRVMRGGLTPQERELIKLASKLTNQMFDFNKNNFYENKIGDVKNKRKITGIYPYNITEEDIDIVGPDYDPVRSHPTNLLQLVVDWHTQNPPNTNPPWQNFVGKLCKVPEGFFTNNEERPQGNLQDVKQNLNNFNPNFPRDPTNANIVEIPFNILGPARQDKAVDINNTIIPPGTYKYAVLSNDDIRYVADTGTLNPYYHFPSVILYFYNQEIISFDELKSYLGNELPHSILFNARTEEILGAGDYTINANGNNENLTGYSGHTKPHPSNVIYSAVKFNELRYPLSMEPIEEIRLQTQRTDRSDINGRLLGSYLSLKYRRPPDEVAAATAVEEDEDDI